MSCGGKKINELCGSTVASGELIRRCQCAVDGFPVAWRTRPSMWRRWLLKDLVIYCRAHSKHFNLQISYSTYCLERSTLAMSNSEELYAGKCCTLVLSAWHVHVVQRPLFHPPPHFLLKQCFALIQPLVSRGDLSQVFWQCCQFSDTCMYFFYLETTLCS